jgi:type VI secretion system secreted protein Hcp
MPTACDNFLYFPEKAKGGLLSDKALQPKGETTDDLLGKAPYEAMEILEFKFGVSQADTAGSATTGMAGGKAKFAEFEITKYVDWASAPLYNACAAGAHFPTMYLAVRKAGGANQIYLQYAFRQVFVTSVNWSGSAGDDAMRENIRFKYAAMGIQYRQQKASGELDGTPMEAFWSLATNKNDFKVPPDATGDPSFIKP